MKHHTIAIISIASFVLLAGCDRLTGTKTAEATPATTEVSQPQAIPVGTQPVKVGPITSYRSFSGDVYPVTTMVILPETSGKIVETLVREGDHVTKGQVVARIDQSRPGMNYHPSDVTSPMEGTLLSFSAQVGGMASPSASLGTIITDKDVEIHFDVVERYLSLVKEGQKVILSFAAYPDETFSGTITRLSPVVDGQSRTRKAYCKLDTPDERIIPGMYAKILLVEQHHDNALLVPSSAVVSHEDGSVIFVLSGNVAKMMKVKTGIQADGMTEIVSGLAKNSVIITQGQATLSDGSLVTVTSQGKGAGQ